MADIELYVSDRGLGYAPPITTDDLDAVKVYSSSAVEPHIWMSVFEAESREEVQLHLSIEQAKLLVRTLETVIAYREIQG